jgi:hypothetical protein
MAPFRFSQTCCDPAAVWFWAAGSRCCAGWSRRGSTAGVRLRRHLLLAALGPCFINFGRNHAHCGSQDPCFCWAHRRPSWKPGAWVDENVLWGVVLVSVALAFLIEWRAVGRQGAPRACAIRC